MQISAPALATEPSGQARHRPLLLRVRRDPAHAVTSKAAFATQTGLTIVVRFTGRLMFRAGSWGTLMETAGRDRPAHLALQSQQKSGTQTDVELHAPLHTAREQLLSAPPLGHASLVVDMLVATACCVADVRTVRDASK